MKFKFYLRVILFLMSCGFFSQGVAQLKREVMKQIELLIQEKYSRTPAQQKMDSRLLQAAREKRGMKMVAGVDLEPANVDADNNGNLEVDIQAYSVDALSEKIVSLGGKIISANWRYNVIRAKINLSAAEQIAGFAEVKFIKPADRFKLVGSGLPLSKRKQTVGYPNLVASENNGSVVLTLEERTKLLREKLKNILQNNGSSFSGTVNSEGDRTHRADDVRNTYGYFGQGIKIGVLSNSYNTIGGAPADVANGNLPGIGNPYGNTTPVTVVHEGPSGNSDEGRAMLQIVHDLAPKAQLFFATAFNTQADFASNILELRNTYHCDIIIDDVSYYAEPVFQDGIIAQAVNTVTTNGALYFSSAGNEGSFAKNTAGVFEGDFDSTGIGAGTPLILPTSSGSVHNFSSTGGAAFGDSVTVGTSSTPYRLTWSDPLGKSTNDYDLFILNSTGTTIRSSSTNFQNGTQDPIEVTSRAVTAADVMVVYKKTGAAARAFSINTFGGGLRHVTTGQIYGHTGAANAFSVAATPAAAPYDAGTVNGPYPSAFNSANQVETFSSDGPRRVFYNADTTPVTPNNFLFKTNGGTVRQKPDITAADGTNTSVSGFQPFYGTSAAAPHAGAIAALLKSANPSLTNAQMRTLLTSNALDIETTGFDNLSGYGIVQAFKSMQSLAPTTSMAALSVGTVTATEGSYKNGNGKVDPGESANIIVQANNLTTANATSVSAVITTSAPGIAIFQSSANYGNITGGSSASNTANPFVIFINSSVPCGTIINFTITFSLTGGVSPQTQNFSIIVGTPANINISSTLDVTAPANGTGYTATTGTQTGRVARDGNVSTCAGNTPPGLTTTTGARQYDAYTFTNSNTVNQCVTVTLTSSNGDNLYVIAYNNSGFVPANPNTNFIGHPGLSASTQTFTFPDSAGKAFTIVVHDVNVTPASNSAYTLNVQSQSCSAPPACTQVTLLPASIAGGNKAAPYSQSFSASGGSGFYSFSLTGALPFGLSFSGNTLSGTPTATGSYPITITVKDTSGCPGNSKNYTLIISAPSSITDYFRTRQSGNWNDINTWESSAVADFSSGVVSPATLTPDFNANTTTVRHNVNVTANVTIDQTVINTGDTVYVAPAIVLTVNDGAGTDVLINNGGNLNIRSTAAGTGSIGNSPNASISGNVTIERYFSNRRAWRLLGIPFSTSSQTIKTAWMEGAANVSANPSPGYGTQITTFTGDANAANFDAVKPASSIRTYSADNFNSDAAHTPNTNNFIVGSQSQAYFLFVRGDRAADRTATATSSATTLRATGAIKVGNVTGVGLTGTGFSLIQNPYPSAINFDSIKAIAANTSISRFYVWDATVGTTGQYRTIDLTGSAPAYTYTATPGSQNNNYKFIESGTAFFIEGNRQMNFTEAVKSAGIPPSSVLRTSPSQQAELGININTVNADNTLSLTDGVREVFDNNYLAAVDNNDAKKIEGFNLNLGIAKGNEVLAIEKRPLPNINDVIALKLWNTVPGNYQFEIDPANIPSQISNAYLYDSYLNSYTSLDLKATTTNNFSITADAASAGANRFSIVFSKPGMVNTKPTIVIYPNPAQNGLIKLQMNNMPKGNYFIKLLNNLGQTILSKQINHAEGTSTETITVNKITGVYMLEIVKPDNTKSSNKLIIN